jgi:hypothetical protein
LSSVAAVLELSTRTRVVPEQTLPSDAVSLAGLGHLKGLCGLAHGVLAEDQLLLQLRLSFRFLSLYLNVDAELQVSEVEVGHDAILLHQAATRGWLSATS